MRLANADKFAINLNEICMVTLRAA